jgi:RNA polymerase sigma factor (sigma-70 family)
MPTTPEKPKNDDTDTELIRAINAGRQDRYYELVKRYEKSLYNFGLRMCDTPSDAEDMVQDTFLNVYKYLNGFRYETKFKNWLYRIATSVCLKKKHRSKFAPERELSLDRTDLDHPHYRCLSLYEHLSEYIDKELDTRTCRDIENHIKACRPCQVCLDTLKQTITLLKHMENVQVPEVFSLKLKALVSKVMPPLPIDSLYLFTGLK